MTVRHHRSNGSLLPDAAFIDSKDDVKGNPVAAQAREDTFMARRIPLAAEDIHGACHRESAAVRELLVKAESERDVARMTAAENLEHLDQVRAAHVEHVRATGVRIAELERQLARRLHRRPRNLTFDDIERLLALLAEHFNPRSTTPRSDQ